MRGTSLNWHIRIPLVVVATFIALAIVPSLFTMVFVWLLFFLYFDYADRKYKETVSSLNAAIRSVVSTGGDFHKVVRAFSRSGSLRGPCTAYSYLIENGEDPIAAAGATRIPLELSTTIAILSPHVNADDASPLIDAHASMERDMVETEMPVFGQILYLIVTVLITCLMVQFLSTFISPTFEKMFNEFGLDYSIGGFRYANIVSVVLLFVLFLVVVVFWPISRSGTFFGIRLPGWFPRFSAYSRRQSEVLHSLADAIDQGVPLERVLAAGRLVSTRTRDARAFMIANQAMEQGATPEQAMHYNGWISEKEMMLLSGRTPKQMASRLRLIADQNVRDGAWNSRWALEIFVPLMILILGTAVLGLAISGVNTLFELINGLS